MTDPAAAVQAILREADELIRRRLKDINVAVPHIAMAVTPGEVILRSNVAPEVLRASETI
jgi:hypothetical protein